MTLIGDCHKMLSWLYIWLGVISVNPPGKAFLIRVHPC
jgi:hypothetical protein